jgi:ABC-type multidrug transport system fused ATPase/permease subunit
LAAVLTAYKRLIVFRGTWRYAMTDYTSFECPSCGSQLQIMLNLERIVCQSCNHAFSLSHSGNVVAINPLEAEVRLVEADIDRTPTETSLQRLKDDISQLEIDISALKNRKEVSLSSLLWLIPIALIAIGVFALVALSSVDAAVWLIAIGLAVALFISLGNIDKAKLGLEKMKHLEEELDIKRKELTNRLEVSSGGR